MNRRDGFIGLVSLAVWRDERSCTSVRGRHEGPSCSRSAPLVAGRALATRTTSRPAVRACAGAIASAFCSSVPFSMMSRNRRRRASRSSSAGRGCRQCAVAAEEGGDAAAAGGAVPVLAPVLAAAAPGAGTDARCRPSRRCGCSCPHPQLCPHHRLCDRRRLCRRSPPPLPSPPLRRPSPGGRAPAGGVLRSITSTLCAFTQLVGTVDHDTLSRRQARGDGDALAVDQPGFDRAHADGSIGFHHIGEGALRAALHSGGPAPPPDLSPGPAARAR